MNKLILFLTITLMLKPIFPVVDYLVNYEYISKVLCENKAKPKLKCNGKCQLMKGLAKASEEEKPINSDKKNNIKRPAIVCADTERSLVNAGFNDKIHKHDPNST